MPEKFISLNQSLYANGDSWFRAYGDVSPELTMRSGVHQRYPFLLIVSSFVSELLMEVALSSCDNSRIDICSNWNLSDLEYEVDVTLLSKGSSKVQVSLGLLNDSVSIFDLHFEPSTCKMPLQNWIGLEPNFVFSGDQLSGEIHLVPLVVVPHLAVLRRMRCLRAYERLHCQCLIQSICSTSVTSGYRSQVVLIEHDGRILSNWEFRRG